jgi:hypothetical protein
MKIDMQFLDHHSKQYLNLHADLIRINYSPLWEAASTNLKAILFIEISLLHGCDDWSPPVAGSVSEGEVLSAGAASAGKVLGPCAPADDADNSGDSHY